VEEYYVTVHRALGTQVLYIYKILGKGKIHPRTGHEGPKGGADV